MNRPKTRTGMQKQLCRIAHTHTDTDTHMEARSSMGPREHGKKKMMRLWHGEPKNRKPHGAGARREHGVEKMEAWRRRGEHGVAHTDKEAHRSRGT